MNDQERLKTTYVEKVLDGVEASHKLGFGYDLRQALRQAYQAGYDRAVERVGSRRCAACGGKRGDS